ncbi:MAG: PEP-CTERM sorting domain-containing protein [Phycisphaerae bacterium]|jgi:hypothetical protein
MRSYGWSIFVVGVLVSVLFTVPVKSAQIEAMQYFLTTGDFFFGGEYGGTMYDREFFIEQTTSESTSTTGWLRLDDTSGTQYEIKGGSIYLSPSELLSDLSYANPIPFFNPYIALGHFASGATLTIEGTLTVQGSTVPIYTGTLLEATVNVNFYGEEQSMESNYIFFQLHFDTTGGELSTGTNVGFTITDKFYIDVELRNCSPAPVTNFQNDMGYAAPSWLLINPIIPTPEPATLLIFGLGAIALVRRKK